MDKLSVEGQIWDMKDGKVTSVNIDGKIFRLEGTSGENKSENPFFSNKKETYLSKWIRKNNDEIFTLEEFFDAYPKQRKRMMHVNRYISEMITDNKIQQIGKDKFKILKKT